MEHETHAAEKYYRIAEYPYSYDGTWNAPQARYLADQDGDIALYTIEEAHAEIERRTTGDYVLAHGEYARPEYRIVMDGECPDADTIPVREGYGVISAEDVPAEVREQLDPDTTTVEYAAPYTGAYDLYVSTGVKHDGYMYRLAYAVSTLALQEHEDDLSQIDWQYPAYIREEA